MSANLTHLTEALSPRREKDKRRKPTKDRSKSRGLMVPPKPDDYRCDECGLAQCLCWSDESFEASEALFAARRSA